MRLSLRDTRIDYGVTESEMHELATYNGEVARGIMHTPEWATRMAALQLSYNAAAVARLRST